MVNYYMFTLPTGSCIGYNASLYRGNASQRRSKKRNRKACIIRKDISRRIFNDYYIILQHHHSLCQNCISCDISVWIKNVKDSSFGINRSMTSLLSKQLKSKKKKSSLALTFDNVTDEECKLFTSLSKAQISEITSAIYTSNQNVFIFFTIMFRGISQVFASLLFKITHQRISQIFHETINKMINVFVPKHLGSEVFKRKNILHDHSPDWIKLLLINSVAMIDSTYIYVQKSWNFNNQKKSYGEHKANNLVKMIAVMLLDGKWFDIYGAYYSNGYNNDEVIWNTLSDDSLTDFENKELSNQRLQLHATFLKNDVFIADRGFTRCKGKWNLYTPDSICKGETQLWTRKANQIRCVTLIRNAIERGFGRLKQWKFIGSTVNTDYIPVIGAIMKILCAVDNAYFRNFVGNSDDAYTNAEAIIDNLLLENEIMSFKVNTTGRRKASTSDIRNAISSYDHDDIKKFSSEYSIRVAHAYLGHSQQQWTVYIHHDFPSTIKIKNILSRYKITENPKKHTVWMRFGQNKLKDVALYCTCKTGLRTAGGACSHVTAVLIALKYWKNNEKIPLFYTKAAALFINVFDCVPYKQRYKNKQLSTENDETISLTKHVILSDGGFTDEESINNDTSSSSSSSSSPEAEKESTDNESKDDESTGTESADDESTETEIIYGSSDGQSTDEERSGNSIINNSTGNNQSNLKKKQKIH